MSGNTKRYIVIGGIVAVIVIVIALIASSLKKLASDEIGLKYDTISKILDDTAKLEGLHNGPPGFKFIKFPSVFKTLEFYHLWCLNKDGVRITLSISYQHRVRAKNLEQLVLQFKDYDGFEDILRTLGEAAIHDSCSKFNTSQFQAERGAFQEEVRQRLVERYNLVYSDVTDLQVNDISRPGPYENAVKAKETAREEIEVARNERPRLLTEARTKKREAETQAEITVDKAMSDARIMENKASTQAEAILNDFSEEAATYKSLINTNRLDTDGFLAYMGIRTISDQKNKVYLGMDAPAKTNWID